MMVGTGDHPGIGAAAPLDRVFAITSRTDAQKSAIPDGNAAYWPTGVTSVAASAEMRD
ncbi:MAG: hypothetical protein ABSE20_22855 [Acetobacteraceae bacterium]|jgi:hypothetical protein